MAVFELLKADLGPMALTSYPSPGKLRQEDLRVEASLRYMGR